MADGPPPLRAHLTELVGRLARLIGSGRSTEGVVAACVRMLESSVSKYELPQVCLPSELLPFPAFPFRRNAAHRRPLASIAAYVMTAKPLPPPPRGPSPLLPPPLLLCLQASVQQTQRVLLETAPDRDAFAAKYAELKTRGCGHWPRHRCLWTPLSSFELLA